MKKSALLAMGAMLVGGAASASNTGFKLNFPLAFISPTQPALNWMAYPTFYYPNGDTTATTQNSVDLCRDLNDFATTPAKVASVQIWQPLNGRAVAQACTNPKAAFTLTPGEGYAVVPLTANVVVNVVGSANDEYAPNKGGTLRYPLQFQLGIITLNWVSVPYHSIADNSVDLCREWNLQTGDKISSVQIWQPTNGRAVAQACSTQKLAFVITPGEAYAAVPNAAGANIGFDSY